MPCLTSARDYWSGVTREHHESFGGPRVIGYAGRGHPKRCSWYAMKRYWTVL